MRESFIVLACAVAVALAATATAAPPPPHLVDLAEADLAAPLPAGAPTDTLYLLGGPAQLSGKFEDAGGLPDRQGWTGIDLTQQTDVWWSISTFNAAALDPSTPGNHAWWCGRLFEPCSPTDPPEGTGDDWSERLVWTGTVDEPGRDVTVRVRARISYGTDPANDFLYLQAWGDPYWTTLRSWTGLGTAVAVDESITLAPDRYSGPGGDQVQLRWLFSSDGAFSDEDCLWPGTGAQVDSIAVTFDQGAGEVLQGTVETCEPGDPQRWVPTLDQGVGDFSAVRANLGDLDPDRDNTSPQFAFIDDGVVVPGTDGQPCLSWCYGPGGWIVNQDRGVADHYAYLHNEIWSPPLPLPAEPWDGALLAFDTYLHLVSDGSMRIVAAVWHIRSTADPAGLDGWSPWRDRGMAYGGGPAYARVHQEVSDLIEPGAAWVQIALGARDLGWSTGVDGTPAPYFDNVALKVYPRAAPAVITVRPDGGGDYATIQAALNAAAAGDTVKLADGIFSGAGNRDLDWLGKDVVVRSASGDRTLCILDCGGSAETPHRAARFVAGEGPGAALMDVSVRNGWENVVGGAVLVTESSPTFVACLFTGNVVTPDFRDGGAVAVRGGAPAFVGCEFRDNEAYYGAAVTAYGGALPVFEDCVFTGNYANRGGSGLHLRDVGTAAVVRGCTFAENTARIFSGQLALFDGAAVDLERTIIAFSPNGPAIYLDSDGTTTATLACCDLYGNPGGNWIGALSAQLGQDGNISADPRFCFGWGNGEPLALMDTSPCAPEANPDCGLIGAHPVGCADPSPVPAELPPMVRPVVRARPNPFNPATVLACEVPRAGPVELRIYDLRDRLVRTLLREHRESGSFEVVWRGDDDAGRSVASGVYLATLTTGDGRVTTKLALVR